MIVFASQIYSNHSRREYHNCQLSITHCPFSCRGSRNGNKIPDNKQCNDAERVREVKIPTQPSTNWLSALADKRDGVSRPFAFRF